MYLNLSFVSKSKSIYILLYVYLPHWACACDFHVTEKKIEKPFRPLLKTLFLDLKLKSIGLNQLLKNGFGYKC